MNKQPMNTAVAEAKPTAKTPAAKPKASFAAASFANLRAAAGAGQGEPLRILLADIDEDPDQPRQTFDRGELENLAESIRQHGVVQPVVVRPAVDGRYMLVAGARRFRASKLAGVSDIPVTIRSNGADNNFAAQVIENQQRAGLSNSELSAAVAKLSDQGKTNKEIGVICSLKDYQVAAFRQAPNFPQELAARIDTADMRALYDLYRQWQKTPGDVLAGLPAADTFITITEARRLIGDITGKPTGSIVLDRPNVQARMPEPQEGVQHAPSGTLAAAPDLKVTAQQKDTQKDQAGQETRSSRVPSAPSSSLARQPAQEPQERSEMVQKPSLAKPHAPVPGTPALPVFVVSVGDGQTGRLVVDKRAERPDRALVAYVTGVEEVDASALRIVRIE